MTIYHGQTVRGVGAVTPGQTADPRVESRYASSYNGGADNTGAMQNYNDRSEALACLSDQQPGGVIQRSRMYLGTNSLQTTGDYAALMNRFVSAPCFFYPGRTEADFRSSELGCTTKESFRSVTCNGSSRISRVKETF
jgi:hypothetical protein